MKLLCIICLLLVTLAAYCIADEISVEKSETYKSAKDATNQIRNFIFPYHSEGLPSISQSPESETARQNDSFVPILIKLLKASLESAMDDSRTLEEDSLLLEEIRNITETEFSADNITALNEQIARAKTLLERSELSKEISRRLTEFILNALKKLFSFRLRIGGHQNREVSDDSEDLKPEHKSESSRHLNLDPTSQRDHEYGASSDLDISKLSADSRTDSSSKDEYSTVSSGNYRTFSGRQLFPSHYPFWVHSKDEFGHDIPPDEKISFGDVLPVKMVKFIKGMVEEAPWEQMFMKMVRMVVDQFVDTIIEKMFSLHDDKDTFRSLKSTSSLLKSVLKLQTKVVRMRRSVESTSSEAPEGETVHPLFRDYGIGGSSKSGLEKKYWKKNENHLSKDEEPKELTMDEVTWVDAFLDYIFPEDSEKSAEGEGVKKRTKRHVTAEFETEKQQMARIMRRFLVKYQELSEGKLSSKDVSDFLKRSSSLFHSGRNRRYPKTIGKEDGGSSKLWEPSSDANYHRKSEICSLRKACHAGRLLARLPSVENIALQLRNHENEPHWDAMLWGMKKKKCSGVFCRRQRSPKGSRSSWNVREARGRPLTHRSRLHVKDHDLTTVFPV